MTQKARRLFPFIDPFASLGVRADATVLLCFAEGVYHPFSCLSSIFLQRPGFHSCGLYPAESAHKSAAATEACLRENASVPNHHPNDANNKQVGRVIQVEKPLHSLPVPSLAIILF